MTNCIRERLRKLKQIVKKKKKLKIQWKNFKIEKSCNKIIKTVIFSTKTCINYDYIKIRYNMYIYMYIKMYIVNQGHEFGYIFTYIHINIYGWVLRHLQNFIFHSHFVSPFGFFHYILPSHHFPSHQLPSYHLPSQYLLSHRLSSHHFITSYAITLFSIPVVITLFLWSISFSSKSYVIKWNN